MIGYLFYRFANTAMTISWIKITSKQKALQPFPIFPCPMTVRATLPTTQTWRPAPTQKNQSKK